jgi:hypothetical protein
LQLFDNTENLRITAKSANDEGATAVIVNDIDKNSIIESVIRTALTQVFCHGNKFNN